jgi:hypothetical protein
MGVKWTRCESDHSPPSSAKLTARPAIRELLYTSMHNYTANFIDEVNNSVKYRRHSSNK